MCCEIELSFAIDIDIEKESGTGGIFDVKRRILNKNVEYHKELVKENKDYK